MNSAELIKVFGAFFAIMNPFVNLPIFLSLTADFSVQQQKRLAIKISIYSLVMAAIIILIGKQIIGFFGISVNDFRIAGGLVLASIAWTMLQGSESSTHHGTHHERSQMSSLDDLAFYPMTFPMIIGPGTIATIIIYSGHATSTSELLMVSLLLAAVIGILFLVLYFASLFGKVLSQTMRVIMTRLMGMILLSIAVEMVVAGIKAVFQL